jgi:voltage-gated potassium channel
MTGVTEKSTPPEKPAIDTERRELLEQWEEWLETPMLLLGAVWLALLVVDLAWGLTPLLEGVGALIWAIFVLDFGVRFTLTPEKIAYLKSNWLTALALLVPALRVFRIVRVVRLLRAARTARGLRLFGIVSSLNRGMRALQATLGRRGFGYVAALTAAITLVGAAGIYAFEKDAPGAGAPRSYGAALWWTAMLMTTMGSEYWPHTPEGRLLCFLLSLYAFAVFGYVTATLATFFVARDAESRETELTGTRSIEALRQEIGALRDEIQRQNRAPGP